MSKFSEGCHASKFLKPYFDCGLFSLSNFTIKMPIAIEKNWTVEHFNSLSVAQVAELIDEHAQRACLQVLTDPELDFSVCKRYKTKRDVGRICRK